MIPSATRDDEGAFDGDIVDLGVAPQRPPSPVHESLDEPSRKERPRLARLALSLPLRRKGPMLGRNVSAGWRSRLRWTLKRVCNSTCAGRVVAPLAKRPQLSRTLHVRKVRATRQRKIAQREPLAREGSRSGYRAARPRKLELWRSRRRFGHNGTPSRPISRARGRSACQVAASAGKGDRTR
jgi:hypothetical protein